MGLYTATERPHVGPVVLLDGVMIAGGYPSLEAAKKAAAEHNADVADQKRRAEEAARAKGTP